MSLSDKYQNHPEFMRVSRKIDAALNELFDGLDIGLTEIEMHRASIDRLADDLARTALKMWDVNHR